MLFGLVAGCGGGTTTTTTVTCRDVTLCPAQEVIQATPTGSNTTEIVVDNGGFSLVATNVPYVTVRVCQPGTTNCATIFIVKFQSALIQMEKPAKPSAWLRTTPCL